MATDTGCDSPPQLTLVARAFCHLCDDLHGALVALKATRRFALRVVDVDSDPNLLQQYDTEVPVLLDGDGNELCRHRIDHAAIAKYLSGFG